MKYSTRNTNTKKASPESLTLFESYKNHVAESRSYKANALAPVLEQARTGIHLHLYEGAIDTNTIALMGDTSDVHPYRILPLNVNGENVGMIVRRTKIASSCAAIIFTWTAESGECGDAHLYYVMNTGHIVPCSTLIPYKVMKKLRPWDVKTHYIDQIKLASLRDYVSQKPLTVGACRKSCVDYTRLDAFVSVIHKDKPGNFWEHSPRLKQTCNKPVPGARRKREINELLESVSGTVDHMRSML